MSTNPKDLLRLEPDIMFQALVYIELAYKEGLIDIKTYGKIMKKYGGKYKNGIHDQQISQKVL